MPKINFKDYSDNYREIKKEDKKKARNLKRQEKLETKNYKYKLNKENMQECFELKKYLEVLKSNVNSLDKNDVRKSISQNLETIKHLKRELIDVNDNVKLFSNEVKNLKTIAKNFFKLLLLILGMLSFMQVLFSLQVFSIIYKKAVQIIILLLCLGIDELNGWLMFQTPYLREEIKVLIGMLPFNNRYSFVKVIRKLEKLEKKYKKFKKQYEDYLKYLKSPEKSEVAENIIKTKEVKDLYLLEINKLVDKVKELPLGEDREKFLVVLEKLTELYKKEKERIILKNGRVHSEEEIELGMSVLKQLAYIEMQINSSIYKNKNVNLLSEDYLTTLGKIDNAKGKKLERTLGLGK